MAYATVEQLTDVYGTAPRFAQQLLDRASRDIDRALLTAVYDATDTTIAAALKDAAIEQVVWLLESGNDRGIRHDDLPSLPSGPAAGSISMSGRPRMNYGQATTTKPVLGEQAFAVLQTAGLTGWGPIPL